MPKTSGQKIDYSINRYLGCFGTYRKSDPICRGRCALNLRCAIEQDRNERFEILEELVTAGDMIVKLQ
ncbi:MAG: hypothetical protein WBY88_01415 [Desulfosarcina sp.]